MLNLRQFSSLIKSTLTRMDLNSPSAVQLLLGTAAQESALCTYIRQINGPALGVFQMEPATETDIWKNYISFHRPLGEKLIWVTGVPGPDPAHLEGNMLYQIAMCRIHYLRVPERLPAPGDIQGMAQYWKQHYNTQAGDGTEEAFVRNFNHYVGNDYSKE